MHTYICTYVHILFSWKTVFLSKLKAYLHALQSKLQNIATVQLTSKFTEKRIHSHLPCQICIKTREVCTCMCRSLAQVNLMHASAAREYLMYVSAAQVYLMHASACKGI